MSAKLRTEDLLKGARSVATESKTFRELTHEKFRANDLIIIKNVLGTDFGWVFTDPAEEVEERPDPATRRIYFGEPKARVLEPKEEITIPGWEAHIALGKMWKAYVDEANDPSITKTSVIGMEEFLNKAYLGVFDPNALNTKSKEKPADTKKSAGDTDLGFAKK